MSFPGNRPITTSYDLSFFILSLLAFVSIRRRFKGFLFGVGSVSVWKLIKSKQADPFLQLY